MPNYSWKEIERILQREGWELTRTGKHKFYEKILPSGELLRTMLTHGSGDIPNIVLRKISKQIRMSIEELSRKK